jgi:hypothetical protein
MQAHGQLSLDGAAIQTKRICTANSRLSSRRSMATAATWTRFGDVVEDEDLRQAKGGVEILWRDASVFAPTPPRTT